MADASPEWKKPCEIMKLRRRKSLVSQVQKGSTLLANTGDSCGAGDDVSQSKRLQKRKNPFASVPAASQVKYSLDGVESVGISSGESFSASITQEQPSSSLQLCKMLDLPCSWSGTRAPAIDQCHPVSSGVIMNLSSESASAILTRRTADSQLGDLTSGNKTFPFDWSLKTKIRYLSSSPFNWCSPLKSADESNGIDNFVTCSPTEEHLHEDANSSSAKQQAFQRHLMYYAHPNIPWLQSFPRIRRNLNKSGQANGILQADDVVKALSNDWCESMNSAYSMVRHGICPYFYVCCQNMTILFRAAGVGHVELNVILTPTSRGLRAALDSEGVEYQLPVHQSVNEELRSNRLAKEGKENSGTEQESDVEPSEELYDLDDGDDTTASSWLQDLGLDKKRYRSVDPSKVRDQRDIFRQIDYRPESTVLVTGGSNVQAFFNYLLNCSTCIATTGPQAGLPPTILAPSAFKGATLQCLKVRQGSIADQQVRHGQQTYTVEIIGPILPHCVAGLSKLFRTTTGGQFSAFFAVHEPTVSFNCNCRSSGGGSENDASDALLSSGNASMVSDKLSLKLNLDVCHEVELGKESLRELVCEHGLFKWVCR